MSESLVEEARWASERMQQLGVPWAERLYARLTDRVEELEAEVKRLRRALPDEMVLDPSKRPLDYPR